MVANTHSTDVYDSRLQHMHPHSSDVQRDGMIIVANKTYQSTEHECCFFKPGRLRSVATVEAYSKARRGNSSLHLLYKLHVVPLLLCALCFPSFMTSVANAGRPQDLLHVPSILLYCPAESCMWLLHLALPAATCPETPLPHAPGALEARQLRRPVIHLPH